MKQKRRMDNRKGERKRRKTECVENMMSERCPHVANEENPVYPGRILDVKQAPHAPYRRRRFEKKTALHWGQRKLLISEIEFLTEYADLTLPVLYVGAAPGNHINVLVELFPDVKFILVDPREFRVRKISTVKIRREVFCDESARDVVKTLGRVNFISDIRSVDWTTHDEKSLENHVWKDMIDQQRWHNILSPHASMLKFRLPWNKRRSDYLKGVILFPVWSAPTSAESRLVVSSSAETRSYDNVKYCNQMFYFQTRTRVSMYGGDRQCYDCISETKILKRYLEKFDSDREMSELSMYISKSLSTLSCLRSITDVPTRRMVNQTGMVKTGDATKLSWD